MERVFSIQFLPMGRRANALRGQRIRDVASAAGFGLQSECEGQGTCGRCMVRLVRSYTEPSDNEVHLFSEGKLQKGFRLACQARVESDLKVLIPEESVKPAGTQAAEDPDY